MLEVGPFPAPVEGSDGVITVLAPFVDEPQTAEPWLACEAPETNPGNALGGFAPLVFTVASIGKSNAEALDRVCAKPLTVKLSEKLGGADAEGLTVDLGPLIADKLFLDGASVIPLSGEMDAVWDEEILLNPDDPENSEKIKKERAPTVLKLRVSASANL